MISLHLDLNINDIIRVGIDVAIDSGTFKIGGVKIGII